ncbi:MAG: glycosyltransferase family 4 protein [Planctomycetota bacterium]|jgi:glycosyltransferase involved in cell wall biosynthesis
MNNEKTESKSGNDTVDTAVRPALIVSDKTINDYQNYLNHLLVGLVDQSIPVGLVCDSQWEIESLVPPSIELIEHNLFSLPWLSALGHKKLLEKLNDFKPTVLHCICEKEIKLVQRLAQQMDLPFMVTVNSLRRLHMRRHLLKNLLAVTVSAPSIAENIIKTNPALADRVKVINMAVFVEESTNCFINLNQQICMVTAGPFKDESIYKSLLGAIRYLAIDGYEFMLFIMGSGSAERKLRKIISALGISEVVTIVPQLENCRSILSAADIFIRPWSDKTFSPFLLEAMSVGAVVAACTGGVDDLIIDGQTAVVFDGNDEISIMNTLKELLNRPEDAHQLAVRAQQYIKEHHKVSDMVDSILQTYRQASNLTTD